MKIGDKVRLPDGTTGRLRLLAPFHHEPVYHECKDAHTMRSYPQGKEWTYIALVTLEDSTDTTGPADVLTVVVEEG